MEKVISTLKNNGLKENELPINLQEKIDYLEGLIEQHNALVDELESANDVSEEQEEQVQEQSERIDELDAKIAKEIQHFIDESKAKKDAENVTKTPDAIEKKSSKGWFIFGALALVVTLGAVNVMNKN